MSKIRLYTEATLKEGIELELNETQSRYLSVVMRVSVGEEVFLFDGKNGEFSSTVIKISKKAVVLLVRQKTKEFMPTSDVWLLFAPIKKDRTDFIVEKATELGVDKIIPVITRYTISEKVRTDRFLAQAIEASEQSRRLSIPKIGDPCKLDILLKEWDSRRRLYYMDETGGGKAAADIFSEYKGPVGLLIGPEGGFSEEELNKLRKCAFARAVSLGPLILRAETAVVSSLSIWQAISGNWRTGDGNQSK